MQVIAKELKDKYWEHFEQILKKSKEKQEKF